jgi:hypothetical protein
MELVPLVVAIVNPMRVVVILAKIVVIIMIAIGKNSINIYKQR